MDYYRKIVKQYLKLSDEANEHCNALYKKLIPKNQKVIGVLARGTDYYKLRPKDHPVQPSALQIIEQVKIAKRITGFEKIFLATEDQQIYDLFKQQFGERVIANPETTIQYNSGYIANNKLNQKEVGMNYLANIYILSKCQAFVAGRTSGTVGVMILSDGFEYIHLFDLGTYD